MQMISIENDLDHLREGVDQLKDYLLSDELFWPMGGRQALALTPGNLLLAQARLQARPLNAVQKNAFIDLRAKLQELKDAWRTAWEKKAAREYTARLRQWGHVLEELAKDPDAVNYMNEVRVRALLELLAHEVPGDRAAKAPLEHLDTRLRQIFQEGDFVWEAEAQPGFSQEQYWFLYRKTT